MLIFHDKRKGAAAMATTPSAADPAGIETKRKGPRLQAATPSLGETLLGVEAPSL